MTFPHRSRRNEWRITLDSPESAMRWRYVIPVQHMGSQQQARSLALMLHAALPHRQEADAVVTDVVFSPERACQRRAVRWAALTDSHRESVRLWGDAWREHWPCEFAELHEIYQQQAVGFGVSLAGIMAAAQRRGDGWDLSPYRDRFARMDWEAVRADIRHGATSSLRQTPYGLLWIDHG